MDYYIEVVFILNVIFTSVLGEYRIVCYYTNWAQYRPGKGKFVPENIDPNLCTHLIYAFAKLDGNRLEPVEWNDESTSWSTGMYEKFNNLKLKNPKLKTLLAVGGWNLGSLPFSKMVSDRNRRAEFIRTTVQFLRRTKFDGLDLDWEYPAARGGVPEDKSRLTSLLKELLFAFERESVVSGKERLLLTAAVPAGKSNIDGGHEVAKISSYLDFISIMTYDFHGSWEEKTGHNSPLYPSVSEHGRQALLNMEWAARYWKKLGAPLDKLNLGFSFYGRSFILKDPQTSDIGAPAKGPGVRGRYTREDGFLGYYEVCKLVSKGAKVRWHDEHMVPYLHRGTQWVGYDNVDSIKHKALWLKQQGFGGAMVWTLALDDFNGYHCNHNGSYPLLKALVTELTVHSATPQGVLASGVPVSLDSVSGHVDSTSDGLTAQTPAPNILYSSSLDSTPATMSTIVSQKTQQLTSAPMTMTTFFNASEPNPTVAPTTARSWAQYRASSKAHILWHW